MSKTKTIKHLEELQFIIQTTIEKINEGDDSKEALRMLNSGLDKKLAAIARDLGGESYFYKGANLTSWQLAMGDVT